MFLVRCQTFALHPRVKSDGKEKEKKILNTKNAIFTILEKEQRSEAESV